MPRYVALLRAINVGGRFVKMEELRAVFDGMGFGQVETFLNSGNVIFHSADEDTLTLAARIESSLQKVLGYPVDAFLRTDLELSAIAAQRPFAASSIDQAATFCVALMAIPLAAEARRKLETLTSESDDFYVQGTEIYWLGKLKQSEAKVSNAVLEKLLGVRMTLRGMSTMKKLAAKYPPG